MSCQSVRRWEDAPMDCSIVICFPPQGGSTVVLQRETRPTWAYPEHYIPALASSVISMLLLLSCLAVGATTNGVVQGRQRFHVLHSIRDGFRSALLHRQCFVRAGLR